MQMWCGAGNSGQAYCTLCPTSLKSESTLDLFIGHLRCLINCHRIIKRSVPFPLAQLAYSLVTFTVCFRLTNSLIQISAGGIVTSARAVALLCSGVYACCAFAACLMLHWSSVVLWWRTFLRRKLNLSSFGYVPTCCSWLRSFIAVII